MNIDIEIIKLIVYLVLVGVVLLVTGFVLPYIKATIGTEKYNLIIKYISQAVNSAEQIFGGEGTGEQKKAYVIYIIQNVLNKVGYKLTEDELNMLIESAVKAMNDAKVINEKLDIKVGEENE